MDIKKLGMLQFLFVLFFSFTTSLAFASDDDITAVSAGVDQVVGLGDTVSLTGVITFEEDDAKKKHRHKKHGKHGKYNKHHEHDKHEKHEKHKKHKKHRKHDGDDDDDEDEIVISWVQTAGTAVILTGANTLTPTFTAPTQLTADEVLTFTLNVSDDDGELIASDTVSITVEVPVSTITGRITAVDGTELAGVTVNVLASGASQTTVTSAANGHFSAVLVANADYVLQFSAAGYADQVVPARSPKQDGSIFLDISMIARGAVQTFDAATDAVITGNDGASVSVAANSFVDANGAVVTGNIDVTVTPVDVSSPATLAAFPGEFSGVLEGAVDDTAIISFGTVEFEFSQNGQPLQLGGNQTAGVLLPIYIDTYQDGSPIAIGDTIPLWSLNEDTGIWVQEGTGTVVASTDSPTGLAMDATVSHFSWWNCDVSANTAQAIVTVFGQDTGTALIKARTTANIGWRPTTVETVSAVAVPTAPLYIPSNGEVCFWAEIAFDNGSNGTTSETCVNAAPSSLINIDLVSPVSGPVNIITTPAATGGMLDVTGYFGFPTTRIQFQPSTFETFVNYSIISGNLPAGLFLVPVNATRAEISGVVAQPGVFNVVVQAMDADGNTDTVTINYTVVTSVPPPVLEQNIEIFYNNIPFSFDLNIYNTNTGGPVSNWALSYNPVFEQIPPPPELVLDPVTGILTATDYCIFWDGILVASNASGSTEVPILVEDGGCH